ncbi:MAG: hypothetical protein AAF799_41145 [Myxococcota bacterium]
MAKLGSIFTESPKGGPRAKGPDLRVEATLTRSQLRSSAIEVTVPDRVPHDGGTVPRRRGPDDPPGAVRLHLSPQLQDGATLRLRGQGGEHPDSGTPGDLLLTLTVVEGGASRGWMFVLLLGAVAAAAAWGTHGQLWGQ